MTHSMDVHQETNSKTFLGFWIYLMTDCVLFATFFATYAVLRNNTAGGPTAKEIFHLPFVLVETLVLLLSSYACGVAMLPLNFNRRWKMLSLFAVAFLLGAAFLSMEWSEFVRLTQEGNSWQRSAFLSAYFSLVGLHGLHILGGLLWMVVLLAPVCISGMTDVSFRRLTCLRLFWHFLYLVWIFTFTFVYLTGVS